MSEREAVVKDVERICGENALDESGKALNELERVQFLENILYNNRGYIECVKSCISTFNALKECLPDRALPLLFDYEESMAFKEVMTIDLLSKKHTTN